MSGARHEVEVFPRQAENLADPPALAEEQRYRCTETLRLPARISALASAADSARPGLTRLAGGGWRRSMPSPDAGPQIPTTT